MAETKAAFIIREASQRKYYVSYYDAEFEYVSTHPKLSPTEKLIWLNVARKSHLNVNLSCRLTHLQIANMVGVKPDTAYRALRNL